MEIGSKSSLHLDIATQRIRYSSASLSVVMNFSPRVAGRFTGATCSRLSVVFRHAATISRPRFYATTLQETESGQLVLKDDQSRYPKETKLPKFWLRDNCRCAQCVNQDTMQRNFDTFKIHQEITPKKISPTSEGVDIIWSDSHQSHYSWSWLKLTVNGSAGKNVAIKEQFWNASIADNPPEVDYEHVMDDGSQSGMAKLTNNIRVYGFCFVTNSPKTPEVTEKLLESIGPIRNTHYGGFYDFIPDLALADTAYTNLALAPHTDTTYFTEPAGLQAFHLLSHTPPANKPADEVLGGQSLLVDGFYAAHRLRKESREYYDLLRTVRLPWHASGNRGVAIAPDKTYPVIESSGGEIHKIRWNNDDRGVVPLREGVDDWYRAARKWDHVLGRKSNQYRFQLEPGRVLIFDNWRVLHGRTAFEGVRRICGGYINRDDFISRWKTTNFPQEDVITGNMQMR